MTDKRSEQDLPSSFKRQKMSPQNGDHESNPYLSHWNEPQVNGYSNGSAAQSTGLSKFGRHKTSMAMANMAEDGPNNPFNSKPLSKQYFSILKVRRNLPVHAQRYVDIRSLKDPSDSS